MTLAADGARTWRVGTRLSLESAPRPEPGSHPPRTSPPPTPNTPSAIAATPELVSRRPRRSNVTQAARSLGINRAADIAEEVDDVEQIEC